jgi:hypothetical protein
MNIKFKDCIKIGAGLYLGWKLPVIISNVIRYFSDIITVIVTEDKKSRKYKNSVNSLKYDVPEVYDILTKEGYIVEQETRRKIGF